MEQDAFVSPTGSKYFVLDVERAKVLSSREFRDGPKAGDDFDPSYTRVLVGPYRSASVDTDTVNELLRAAQPVLMVFDAAIPDPTTGVTHFWHVLKGAGTLAQDGSVDLLGECGRSLQPAIDAGAAQFGAVADAAWLTTASDPESAQMDAISTEFLAIPDPVEVFNATTPSERNLNLTDVPREVRRNYLIVPLHLEVRGEVPAGGIAFSSTGGHSAIIDLTTDTITAILRPPDAKSIDVYYVTPDWEMTLVGSIQADLFDPDLGVTVTISSDSLKVSVAVNPMAQGELEERLHMTRDQIAAYREDLYDL